MSPSSAASISGERKFDRRDDRSYHRIERADGAFIRTFSLPRSVDPSKIVANYRHGVLEIEIPKKEESKPKQIQINVGSQKSIDTLTLPSPASGRGSFFYGFSRYRLRNISSSIR